MTSTNVQMSAPALSAFALTASDGRFTFRGVPPGLKTLTASIGHSQGSALIATATATTAVGATIPFDSTFPPPAA